MSATAINSFFAQRQEEKTQKGGEAKKFLSKDEKKRKFFAPKAEEENFRIVKPEGGNHYELAYFHELASGDGFGTQQYYCLQHNDGKPCPICEKREALKAESRALPFGSDEAKAKFKESNAYEPRKFYIFKGISRGHLSDGLKFWRVKENFKKEGAMDLIEGEVTEWAGENSADFADTILGADLKIKTIEKSMTTGNKTYRAIQSIRFTKAKPLADDEATIAKLVNDPMTWKEIYTPIAINGHLDEYQFLQAVLDGRAPEWDKDAKKWLITRENGEQYMAEYARENQGGEPAATPAPVAKVAPAAPAAAPKKAPKAAPVAADDDNDLPF
jgi:hypothetical protein